MVFFQRVEYCCQQYLVNKKRAPHNQQGATRTSSPLVSVNTIPSSKTVTFSTMLALPAIMLKMPMETNSVSTVAPLILEAFDKKTDHRLLYRRLGICAENVRTDNGFFQLNMFIDYEALTREKRLQGALGELRSKYGSNAVFKGNNLLEGATQLERNKQIGGHRA